MKKKNIVGDKIAAYRSMLRMNRPALINKLNAEIGSEYTSQALYSWETGKAQPPAYLLPDLARVLQVNLLQLFGDDEVQANSELIHQNKKMTEELEAMKKELEELKGENKKLEGKLEASMSILGDMMNRQEKK